MVYSRRRSKEKRLINHILLFILLLIIVSLICYKFFFTNDRPNSNKYPIMGISINQNDNDLNFQNLKKSGVDFVYIQSTSGESYSNNNFEIDFSSAKGSFIPIGVYHCFSFSSSPISQAKYFISQTGYQIGNLPIAIYLNYYGNYQVNNLNYVKLQNKINIFIKIIYKFYRRPCIIWGPAKLIDRLHNLNAYTWIISNNLTHQRKKIKFWEYNSNGYINRYKISTPFPLSVYTGDKNSWLKFINNN